MVRLRFLITLSCCLITAPVLSEDGSSSSNNSGAPVVKVVEEWELKVTEPDASFDLPQIVTAFGPDDPAAGLHAVYELNHGTLPEFSEGGMQLSLWSGEQLQGYRRQRAPTEFGTPNEVVTFKTITAIDAGRLLLSVEEGNSTTFGEFGGDLYLRVSVSTELTNLNTWNGDYSTDCSRVSYGGNRVAYFKRKAVHKYDHNNDLISSDTTVVYIHDLGKTAVQQTAAQ